MSYRIFVSDYVGVDLLADQLVKHARHVRFPVAAPAASEALALASIAGDAAEIVAAAPAALSARVEHRFQLFKRLILESSVVEMEYLPPWHDPELAEWTIVGMNHYQQNGMRRLFVAMTRRGVCIQAEGKDAPALWEELRRQAAEQKYSPLDLSKAEHDGT